MNSLPHPIPSLIFASLGVSTTVTAFALTGLSLLASPLLWIIPGSFATTFFYHISILILARVEPHGSKRLFSKLRTIYGFIIAVLWSLCTCVTITATVLKAIGVFPKYEMRVGLWLMIVCAIIALIESGILWAVAIFCRKERKKITYAAKWRPLNTDLSWSFARI